MLTLTPDKELELLLNNIFEIINDLETLSKKLDKTQDKIQHIISLKAEKVALAFSYFFKLLSQGKSTVEASKIAAAEFNIKSTCIMTNFAVSKKKRKALELYAKAYTAYKMSEKGYTNKEIGEVLNCRADYVPTVRKRLKSLEVF